MHNLIESSRRDDLESIGYCLVYFYVGKLPWQGLPVLNGQSIEDAIKEKKCNISIDDLCKGLPIEFKDYFYCVSNLSIKDEPDYSFLRNLFKAIYIRNTYGKVDRLTFPK